jgi:hypothetical protein
MNENEMNFLENQLRSWQPRRPSPKIEARLFPGSGRSAPGLSLRWIAPAMACLLLTLTIVSQERSFSAGSPLREPVMGAISSNVFYTTVTPGMNSEQHNPVSPATFEWTNLSRFTSSISPFSPGAIN